MRAVLTLPEGVNLPTGSNQAVIGTMNGGTSTTVSWTVVFEKNGTHTLQVDVSGLDSNGAPCAASQSTTVRVGDDSWSESLPWTFYAVLIAIGLIAIASVGGALIIRKRRRGRLVNHSRLST